MEGHGLGRVIAGTAPSEENAGATNTSLIRLECHALFGVERQDAALRLASEEESAA
jgi:hypothetical protein